ncbi:MAG: type IV pilus modification PilV family protein [Actinomycetota bacterium]
MFRRIRSGQRGFTLIETMAAISIFTIISLGLVPTLLGSMRGATLSRQLNVGKNLAQEAVERIRGLPYYDNAPGRDVLDFYFPNLLAGYNSATKTFTTTCTNTTVTPSASGALACPPMHADGTSKIPAGYTITFTTAFVNPVASGGQETFAVVTPPAGYDSAAAGVSPPANLLRVVTKASWTQGGTPKEFELTTIIGDVRVTPDRVRATAMVDFTIEGLSAFQESTDRLSNIRSVVGRSQSDAEIKAFAAATQHVSAGRVTLSRQEFGTTPGSIISDNAAAESSLRTPPNVTPTASSKSGFTVVHPDLNSLPIAFLDSTIVNESSTPSPGVAVTNELPQAAGNFRYTGSNNNDVLWFDNQASTGKRTELQLVNNKPLFFAQPTSTTKIMGNSSVVTTDMLPTNLRKVEAVAHAEVGKMVFLPVTFANGSGGNRGVVFITDFRADVSCTANGTAGVATGSWSATFNYWKDNFNNDSTSDGGYVQIPLSGSTTTSATDQLAGLMTQNPRVFDSSKGDNEDVFLFDDPAAGKLGYLQTLSSNPQMTDSTDATSAQAGTDKAITMVAALTDQDNPETRLAITVGKLSCQAVDKRV